MQAPFMDLANKVVLITGASSGIGEAAAYAFAALGSKVVLGARRQSEGEAVAAKIRAEGGEAIFVQTDVLQESDIARLVATAVQSFGRLDVAFNNAGTEGEFSPLIEQSTDNYDFTMNTNVRSVLWSMRHQIPAMLANGGGAIINNASIVADIGFANAAVYTASKGAVVSMTRVAAVEYFKQGVRINTISPGVTFTLMSNRLIGDLDTQNAFLATTPAGRAGHPAEIAAAVVFLASNAASYISGQTLNVDGGYTIA